MSGTLALTPLPDAVLQHPEIEDEMAGLIVRIESTEMQAAWPRVFDTNDPFTWPFREEFELGRVFFPTDGCHLTRTQYSALLAAMECVGEREFLLSVVESEGTAFLNSESGHWTCNSPKYEGYEALHLALENALVSKSGQWGILVSHEMHAMIGGTKDFLAALDDHYDEFRDDLRRMRKYWADNSNADWLEPAISKACIG